MTISVIVPACEAEATIARALQSLLDQTDTDWQAILVSDDGRDYQDVLSAQDMRDKRFQFATTGQIRSGCHNARNVGFRFAEGEYVTQLDADDTLRPERFEILRPLAKRYGAAADNLMMIDEETEALIGTTLVESEATQFLTLADFMTLNAPLVPLIRRDHVLERVKGVEFSEDVIANIQLIDRIDALPVTATSSYIYRIHSRSMANTEGAALRFERGYSDYIERLETGDGFGLKHDNRIIARDGFDKKRALNRAFMEARKREPELTFAEFVKMQEHNTRSTM
jgi:glycosyltransferase involved in cell wall biosynthesis